MKPMVHAATLNAWQFEVIFQLTYQLTEVREASLAERGCSQEDTQALLAAVWEMRAFVDRTRTEDTLTITVGVSEQTDVQRDHSPASVRHSTPPPTELSTLLPRRLALLWPPILRFTVDALGEAEIFYRTGYRGVEIDEALRALEQGDESTL
ncbi:hypothetical protein [Streptomyces buecherae]|uniref:Uncharacterized protein n=1 Tax=Streptomyces buecherae TaxID=2763006 RepID=A0A7H8N9U9_9ACTN|nr:hypothetical protein [Streptomyces buecherae]QKW50528.1 hypothetical protein HUT08_14420 [Streptomyces buecherae]